MKHYETKLKIKTKNVQGSIKYVRTGTGSEVKAAATQWIVGHRAILTHDRNGRGVFPRKSYFLLHLSHYKGRIRCLACVICQLVDYLVILRLYLVCSLECGCNGGCVREAENTQQIKQEQQI